VLCVEEKYSEVIVTVETTADFVGCPTCGVRDLAKDRVRVDIRNLPCFGRPAARCERIRRRMIPRDDIPDQATVWGSFEDVGVPSIHIQSAISLQNSFVRWGWRPHMQTNTSDYGVILVAPLPHECIAWLRDEDGIASEPRIPHCPAQWIRL
jgi:hypothetical protein